MPEPTNISRTPPVWTGRLPVGLTISMIALASSLAVMLTCWNLKWPTDDAYAFLAHTGAGLCLAWGIVIYAFTRLQPRLIAPLPTGFTEAGSDMPTTTFGSDLLAALQTVQTALGLLASIIMVYVAVAAVLTRVPSSPLFSYVPQFSVHAWPSGLIDLAMLSLALLMAWWRMGTGVAMTVMLWVGVLASLWIGLQIADTAIRPINGIPREVWIDWVSPFVLCAAMVLTASVAAREWLAHRRRVSAWPDRLNHLLLPLPAWPGFRHSAGIVAAMILVLGCMMIVSPLTPASTLLAGVSMLVLAHRRWEENLADAAIGLITLTVVSLVMLTVPASPTSPARHFSAIFSRAVLGLAIMTAFWHWMTAVWHQQLDDGRAWTTAGRLIRPCRRVTFLAGATGVLVSLHLAFWPRLPFVVDPDNTAGEWAWGLAADLLLVAALVRSARKTGKPTLAWLATFAMASTILFVVNRIPKTHVYTVLLQYWPLILAVMATLLILLARRCWGSKNGRAFFEPVYVCGVLVLPMAAISGAALLSSYSIPTWVDPATFAALAGTYLAAAYVTGPRRFVVLAVVCAAAATANLLRI